MSRSPRLEFRNVTKRFANPRQGGSVVAVEGVSFSIADGEVVSLIGPSGCGKSTLLNMGSGLDPASSGEIRVDGDLVTKLDQQFDSVLKTLDGYRDPSALGGWKPYTAELQASDSAKLTAAIQPLHDSLASVAQKVV